MMSETLALKALLERSSMRPGRKEDLHLLVEVEAIGAPVDAARPALSVVFVLDASGSMSGTPLMHVIESVEMLVDLLSPEDKVGVVSFSDDAAEVCSLSTLTPEAKRTIKRRTAGIRALASTNIEAGLKCAEKMLGARTPNERQVILLLSDGAPNLGAASPAALEAVVQPMRANASVSTLGYGASHNSDVLHSISVAGGGQYWFVPDPQQASVEFARALGAQGDIVADTIELVLSPAERSEVKDVLGQKVRFGKTGPVVALPDLREKQKRLVVASLTVDAPTEPGPLPVVEAVVRYKAAGKADVRELRVPVKIDVVDREPQVVIEAHHASLMARAEIVRVEARVCADRGSFDQGAAMLRKMIGDLEKAPGYKQADGTPLSECVEQLIDEAVEYEQRPSAERYAAFKATQLGVEVSQGAKHAAAWGSSSSKSAAIMAGATGPALPGCIVVMKGGAEVQRVPLAPEMTLGRSMGNEIVVPSGSLSRRHTKFVCKDGKVIVLDLHSTNGTLVNGKRISAPTIVGPQDKVQVGEFDFRVEIDVDNSAKK